MSIKHKIKIRNDASKSVFKDKTISDDYKSGGAYKAMLNMFADQLDDEKFVKHCKKFFKGEESGEPSGPAPTVTQTKKENK
jgi:hypothetical protein